MKCRTLFSATLIFISAMTHGQSLKPGFDKQEYIGLMKISAQFGDSAYIASIPAPEEYRFVYRSPICGLDNCWELWMEKKKGIAVISIRGTTGKQESWMANFYAALVPAKGVLHLSGTDSFPYELADNPRAAVHVGWLVSTAFLSRTILHQMDSLYKTGSREFIIMGHSQGGAIAYLLTAYLAHLQQHQAIPADIHFKTYCSAGPKPGNLYFAYDYEAATQAGWAYNVVNSADWVPETPVSVQTINDYNTVNPFIHIPTFIKKQKWPARWILWYAYGRINTPNQKTARNYQKYLGKYVAKSIKRYLPGFQEPDYYNSNDYTRAGAYIVLKADDAYYAKFPQGHSNIFVNHFHQPYLYLTERLSLGTGPGPIDGGQALDGEWTLNYLAGPGERLDSLYGEKKPHLQMDSRQGRFSGNTGCNVFNGIFVSEDQKIHFPDPVAMTRMMCPGTGEPVFLEALKTVTNYARAGDRQLIFFDGTRIVMQWLKN